MQQASSPGVQVLHSSSAMPGVTLARFPDPPKPQSALPRRLCPNVWNQTGVKWNSLQPSQPTVQVSKQPRTHVLAPGSRWPGHIGNQVSKSTLFQTGDLNRTVLPARGIRPGLLFHPAVPRTGPKRETPPSHHKMSPPPMGAHSLRPWQAALACSRSTPCDPARAPHQPLHRELAHGTVGSPLEPLELSHLSPTWPAPPLTSSL